MSDRVLNPSAVYESLADSGGSSMMSTTIPCEVWNQFGRHLSNPADIKTLRDSCVSGFNAAAIAQTPRISAAVQHFRRLEFTVPTNTLNNATDMHPIVPDGRGLIVFVDESNDPSRGIEIVWKEGESMIQLPLGVPGLPGLLAKKVTDIRFSPCGNQLAMLMTTIRFEVSSFHCPNLPGGTEIEPQGDSTVLVADLERSSDGSPRAIRIYNHVSMFVPEYGFDMVWGARGPNAVPDLFFAAMVHGQQGAEILLVRWINFRETRPVIISMEFDANVTPSEFWKDKIKAIQEQESSCVTSRVELSHDGRTVYFDTASVCGILKIQLDMSAAQGGLQVTPSMYVFPLKRFFKEVAFRMKDSFPSTLRISPDGSLVCALVNLPSMSAPSRPEIAINMIAIPSGKFVFSTVLPAGFSSPTWEFQTFDKHPDLANQVLGFSADSSLVWVRSCIMTTGTCWIDYGCLPAIFDARSGRMLQSFGKVAQPYHYIHVPPCVRIVYGTRREMGRYVIDAIDVISGKVVKTVRLSSSDIMPGRFLMTCIHRTFCDTVTAAAFGNLDVQWEMTRETVGTQWNREAASRSVSDLYL